VSDYHLNRALYDAAREHKLLDAITDDAVLDGYELTADEREALRAGDIKRLYELGANPYLIRRVFRSRFPV
jgi:hypothetical protein